MQKGATITSWIFPLYDIQLITNQMLICIQEPLRERRKSGYKKKRTHREGNTNSWWAHGLFRESILELLPELQGQRDERPSNTSVGGAVQKPWSLFREPRCSRPRQGMSKQPVTMKNPRCCVSRQIPIELAVVRAPRLSDLRVANLSLSGLPPTKRDCSIVQHLFYIVNSQMIKNYGFLSL